MGVDNIVIPGGILSTWPGLLPLNDSDNTHENECFDITEVARRRARTLSVVLDSQSHDREDTFERLARIVQLNETTQTALQQESTPSVPKGNTPQRSTTINLGGLGRTRVTGRSTPANPGLRIDRRASNFFATGSRVTQKPFSEDTTRKLENSYVFQSLENYQLPGQRPSSEATLAPVFLARNNSDTTATLRREWSNPKVERNQSVTSQFASIDVVRRASIVVENAVEKAKETVASVLRRSSLQETYEKAKIRQVQLMRSPFTQYAFEYFFYLLMAAFVYFVFVGYPLWTGLVMTIYYLFDMKLVVPAGTAIFLGIGFLYAYLPLLILFEKEPPARPPPDSLDQVASNGADDTALLIPCYKSESLIAATLEAALKVFPAQNIFVIANGNSPTPLDNTAAVCERYGVSHTWSPIGSKIVAQYVGCYISKQFPYALLIDDDCLLPPNFPIVTDRLRGKTMCIGYTIKSVGPNSSKGTLCQQAQDVEYKISGIQRAFAGKVGSATFPHGAISIWDRELLIKTFQAHPGFSVSEDWFFGHVARQLGCRIKMCTAVFVETETPTAIFLSGGGARGGFGEMTIWKQRFFRWNYFFVSGIYWDMFYIIRNWKLGFWEIGAKLFVFQEVYETLLYLLAPFVLPISFYVRPLFSGYLYIATLALYQINVILFNYIHLRMRNESVSVLCLLYYLPYKIILTFVNIASCYYSIYKYAKYFAKRHPKVIEDEKAVAVVLRLEEESYSKAGKTIGDDGRTSLDSGPQGGRRFTVTAVGTDFNSAAQEPRLDPADMDVDVVDFATQLPSVPEDGTPDAPLQLFPTNSHRPPPVPPSRRPWSWHRGQRISTASSGSNVSPLDERKQPPKYPIPAPPPPTYSSQTPTQIAGEEEENPPPALEESTPQPRQTSPSLLRRSNPLNILRSLSDRRPQVRGPSGAPLPTSPFTSILLPLSRHDPDILLDDRILPITRSHPLAPQRPTLPAPTHPQHPTSRHFIAVSSAQDIGAGWPLRGSQNRARPQSRVMGYVNGSTEWFLMDDEKVVEEEEGGEEGEEDTLTLRDAEEFEGRESMQRERGRDIV